MQALPQLCRRLALGSMHRGPHGRLHRLGQTRGRRRCRGRRSGGERRHPTGGLRSGSRGRRGPLGSGGGDGGDARRRGGGTRVGGRGGGGERSHPVLELCEQRRLLELAHLRLEAREVVGLDARHLATQLGELLREELLLLLLLGLPPRRARRGQCRTRRYHSCARRAAAAAAAAHSAALGADFARHAGFILRELLLLLRARPGCGRRRLAPLPGVLGHVVILRAPVAAQCVAHEVVLLVLHAERRHLQPLAYL